MPVKRIAPANRREGFTATAWPRTYDCDVVGSDSAVGQPTPDRRIPARAVSRRTEAHAVKLEPSRGNSVPTRVLTSLGTAAVLAMSGTAAWTVLSTSNIGISAAVRYETFLLIAVPGALLSFEAARPHFNLSLGIYWAWSFVFMGLAPAYQISTGTFPWRGRFTSSILARAELLVLTGHLCVAVASAVGRRKAVRQDASQKSAVSELATDDLAVSAIRRLLTSLSWAYSLLGFIFIVLMGGDLYHARANFRGQLLKVAALPFGGTLYFLVGAGAITIPAAAIIARRWGVPISTAAIVTSACVAAVATNPLIGSRFLSGSFAVAVLSAMLWGRPWLRVVPAVSVLLLVYLFASTDILRGDGTGSRQLAILKPSTALTSTNFDAFEMLAREVSLGPGDHEAMPSRIDLAAAPVARWIPIVARPFAGKAGGAVVAQATGMQYTNVSMPLWGEGDLDAGLAGTISYLSLLGFWMGISGGRRAPRLGTAGLSRAIVTPGAAAILFVLLRGSLYEVFGYLAFSIALYWRISVLSRRHLSNEEPAAGKRRRLAAAAQG